MGKADYGNSDLGGDSLAYQKTEWKDELLTGPPLYDIKAPGQNILGADIEMITTVQQAGTPLTAFSLNKIEQGIFDALGGLGGSSGQTRTTIFRADGSIVETVKNTSSGEVLATLTTVFNVDGSITETLISGSLTLIKTTTFAADGSISEAVKQG